MSPRAEPEVIEAAFRRLARKYHPDVSRSPESARRMRQITFAYEVLSDPVRRAEYDATLATTPGATQRSPRPDWWDSPPPPDHARADRDLRQPASRSPTWLVWLYAGAILLIAFLLLRVVRAAAASGLVALVVAASVVLVGWYAWYLWRSERS